MNDRGRGVLDGAFILLDVLSDIGEAGLSRIAVASGLPKATAHRQLEQLTALGAVVKADGRYRIGPRTHEWGQAWRSDQLLLGAASAPMRRVVRATGATICLVTLSGDQITVLGGMAGEFAHLVPVGPGMVHPRATAAGRALRTGVGGVEFDRQETLRGVSCVAVPVGVRSGTPAAALCAMVGTRIPLLRLAGLMESTATLIEAAPRRRT